MPARLCSKSFKLGFSNTQTETFQVYKLDFKKAEEPEIKLSTFVVSWRKSTLHKNMYFCFLDCAKTFDCVDHNKVWKILSDGNI